MLAHAPTPLENELLIATKQPAQGTDEDHQVYLVRLVNAANKLSDARFAVLTGALQHWLNEGGLAMGAGSPIVDFTRHNDCDDDEDEDEETMADEDEELDEDVEDPDIDDDDYTTMEELGDLGWKNLPFGRNDRGADKRHKYYVLGFRLMRDEQWSSPYIAKTLKIGLNTVNNWRRVWLKNGWIKSDAYEGNRATRKARNTRELPEKDAAIKMFQAGSDIAQVRAAFPNVTHSSIKRWKLQSGPIKGHEESSTPTPSVTETLQSMVRAKLANNATEYLQAIARDLQICAKQFPEWGDLQELLGASIDLQVSVTLICKASS